MTNERGIRRGIRRLFHLPVRREALTANDIDAEIEHHLRERRDQLMARGYTQEAAEAEARRRFGEAGRVRERLIASAGRRDRRLSVREWQHALDAFGQDLRYALRMMIKTPVLTSVALLTLVLGIGANLAIYGIVNAVLLQPLAFPEPDRLVRVFDDVPGAGARDVGMSVPEMADVSAQTDVFEQITGFISASAALAGGDHVERVEVLGTLPSYFDVLGAKAAIGRAYSRAEWAPGFTGSVVISDGL